MKNVLSSRPVLRFLFLFNAIVAVAAYFVLDGPHGLATSLGMGVVALGALAALLKGRGAQAPTGPTR